MEEPEAAPACGGLSAATLPRRHLRVSSFTAELATRRKATPAAAHAVVLSEQDDVMLSAESRNAEVTDGFYVSGRAGEPSSAGSE